MPIYGLFDYNPDGYSIFLLYKRGSFSQPESYLYALVEMELLGLKFDHFLKYLIKPNCLMKQTKRDKVILENLLKDLLNEFGLRGDKEKFGDLMIKEIEKMFLFGHKIELEALIKDIEGDLGGDLDGDEEIKLFLSSEAKILNSK